MFGIQLGVSGPEPTPEEQYALAVWLTTLLNDTRFQSMMVRVADTCVRDWSLAKTTEAREEAHAKWRGLKAIELEMNKIVDQGARIAKSGAIHGADQST